jgi:hypothetical protein
MNSQRRAFLLATLAVATIGSKAATSRSMIIGTYELPRMKAIKSLTFPRVHLYDSKGSLVARDRWPRELAAVNVAAGEAFCCVSDKPVPPGWVGPPPDCKLVPYGEDINEHFIGLQDAQGSPIKRSDLPMHRYLIVEYYAAWCAPCNPARRALEDFLAKPESEKYVALVVDFTKLVADE